MKNRNNGINEEHRVQNQFTAYLLTSVKRCRQQYMEKDYKYRQSQAEFDERYITEETDDCWRFESDVLDQALAKLSDRERYVLLSRVLKDKSFEEIGKPLGLRYKGVTALYSRTLAKVRKMLEEVYHELL